MGCWEVISCGPAEAQSGWYFRNEVEVLLILILLTGAIWPEVHSSNWWIFSLYISKDRIHVSPDCCCILSLRLWHWAKCPLFTLGVIHSSMNWGKFWPKWQAWISEAYLHFHDSEKSTCTVFSLHVFTASILCMLLPDCEPGTHVLLFSLRWVSCWSGSHWLFGLDLAPTASIEHWFHLSLEPKVYAWFCTVNRCEEDRPQLLECSKLIENHPPVWLTLEHPMTLEPEASSLHFHYCITSVGCLRCCNIEGPQSTEGWVTQLHTRVLLEKVAMEVQHWVC